MLRLGLCALAISCSSLMWNGADEPKKVGSDTTSVSQSKEKSAGSGQLESGEKKKVSHDDSIAAFLESRPDLQNPKGKLKQSPALNALSRFQSQVLNSKATERAFTGEYWNHHGDGTYICRRCNAPLYRSTDKFDSQCGWPSFDDEIPGLVTRIPDKDRLRTEIVCTNCGGHLGHVFKGEQLTKKDTRHCVNSASIQFISKDEPLPDVVNPDETPQKRNEKSDKSKVIKDGVNKDGTSGTADKPADKSNNGNKK